MHTWAHSVRMLVLCIHISLACNEPPATEVSRHRAACRVCFLLWQPSLCADLATTYGRCWAWGATAWPIMATGMTRMWCSRCRTTCCRTQSEFATGLFCLFCQLLPTPDALEGSCGMASASASCTRSTTRGGACICVIQNGSCPFTF